MSFQFPSQSNSFQGQKVWISPLVGSRRFIYDWIVMSHGGTIEYEMNTPGCFHLLEQFEGPIFDELCKVGAKIIGMRVLSTSAIELRPLPSLSNDDEPNKWIPLWNRALLDQVIVGANISEITRKNIAHMTVLSGGRFHDNITESTTYLVARRVGGQVYRAAVQYGISIVTLAWIKDVWIHGTLMDASAYALPCFQGLVISASGFSKPSKTALINKIEENGGEWSGDLRRSCSVLVVDQSILLELAQSQIYNSDGKKRNTDDAEEAQFFSSKKISPKIQFARKWNISIVDELWIQNCIDHGVMLPLDSVYFSDEFNLSILAYSKQEYISISHHQYPKSLNSPTPTSITQPFGSSKYNSMINESHQTFRSSSTQRRDFTYSDHLNSDNQELIHLSFPHQSIEALMKKQQYENNLKLNQSGPIVIQEGEEGQDSENEEDEEDDDTLDGGDEEDSFFEDLNQIWKKVSVATLEKYSQSSQQQHLQSLHYAPQLHLSPEPVSQTLLLEHRSGDDSHLQNLQTNNNRRNINGLHDNNKKDNPQIYIPSPVKTSPPTILDDLVPLKSSLQFTNPANTSSQRVAPPNQINTNLNLNQNGVGQINNENDSVYSTSSQSSSSSSPSLDYSSFDSSKSNLYNISINEMPQIPITPQQHQQFQPQIGSTDQIKPFSVELHNKNNEDIQGESQTSQFGNNSWLFQQAKSSIVPLTAARTPPPPTLFDSKLEPKKSPASILKMNWSPSAKPLSDQPPIVPHPSPVSTSSPSKYTTLSSNNSTVYIPQNTITTTLNSSEPNITTNSHNEHVEVETSIPPPNSSSQLAPPSNRPSVFSLFSCGAYLQGCSIWFEGLELDSLDTPVSSNNDLVSNQGFNEFCSFETSFAQISNDNIPLPFCSSSHLSKCSKCSKRLQERNTILRREMSELIVEMESFGAVLAPSIFECTHIVVKSLSHISNKRSVLECLRQLKTLKNNINKKSTSNSINNNNNNSNNTTINDERREELETISYQDGFSNFVNENFSKNSFVFQYLTSTDWLCDSILLQLRQSEQSYLIEYVSQEDKFVPIVPVYWTSSGALSYSEHPSYSSSTSPLVLQQSNNTIINFQNQEQIQVDEQIQIGDASSSIIQDKLTTKNTSNHSPNILETVSSSVHTVPLEHDILNKNPIQEIENPTNLTSMGVPPQSTNLGNLLSQRSFNITHGHAHLPALTLGRIQTGNRLSSGPVLRQSAQYLKQLRLLDKQQATTHTKKWKRPLASSALESRSSFDSTSLGKSFATDEATFKKPTDHLNKRTNVVAGTTASASTTTVVAGVVTRQNLNGEKKSLTSHQHVAIQPHQIATHIQEGTHAKTTSIEIGNLEYTKTFKKQFLSPTSTTETLSDKKTKSSITSSSKKSIQIVSKKNKNRHSDEEDLEAHFLSENVLDPISLSPSSSPHLSIFPARKKPKLHEITTDDAEHTVKTEKKRRKSEEIKKPEEQVEVISEAANDKTHVTNHPSPITSTSITTIKAKQDVEQVGNDNQLIQESTLTLSHVELPFSTYPHRILDYSCMIEPSPPVMATARQKSNGNKHQTEFEYHQSISSPSQKETLTTTIPPNNNYNNNDEMETSEQTNSFENVQILSVEPSKGSIRGGQNVIVTLDHILPNLKVVFGQVVADTCPHPTLPMLWAISPPSAVPLRVEISIIDNQGNKLNTNLIQDDGHTHKQSSSYTYI